MTTKKNDGQGLDVHAFPPRRLQPSLLSRRANPIEGAIGRKMRAMYDELLHQPMPDRLVELLKQIDQARETKSR
jgi:Anti-sigma factor NepR